MNHESYFIGFSESLIAPNYFVDHIGYRRLPNIAKKGNFNQIIQLMIKNYVGLLTCEDYKCDSQSTKPKILTAIQIQVVV